MIPISSIFSVLSSHVASRTSLFVSGWVGGGGVSGTGSNYHDLSAKYGSHLLGIGNSVATIPGMITNIVSGEILDIIHRDPAETGTVDTTPPVTLFHARSGRYRLNASTVVEPPRARRQRPLSLLTFDPQTLSASISCKLRPFRGFVFRHCVGDRFCDIVGAVADWGHHLFAAGQRRPDRLRWSRRCTAQGVKGKHPNQKQTKHRFGGNRSGCRR